MVELENKELLNSLLEEVRQQFPLIINVSHQKGGVGKSTIAYNLSEGFRTLGFKVKLLDVDIQNTCAALNSLRETPFDDIEIIEKEDQLIEHINNSTEDGSEIIIIDTGGFDSALSRLSIMGADINLTPVADKVTELLAVVQKYSQTLSEIKKDTETEVESFIILNRIHPFATHFEHIEEMVEGTQMSMLDCVIRERSIYDKSLITGNTVFESAHLTGYEQSVDEILLVCYEIIKKHVNKG